MDSLFKIMSNHFTCTEALISFLKNSFLFFKKAYFCLSTFCLFLLKLAHKHTKDLKGNLVSSDLT